MIFEEVHRAFMPFRRGAGAEGAEVLALTGLGVHFSGIQPIGNTADIGLI